MLAIVVTQKRDKITALKNLESKYQTRNNRWYNRQDSIILVSLIGKVFTIAAANQLIT